MKLLDPLNYNNLAEPLREVTINNLFARSVIEKGMSGSVFVDDQNDPKTFYIRHSYGMTLLFGNSGNEHFNLALKEHALNLHHTRDSFEWMQAFPGEWDTVLTDLFGDHLIRSSENTNKQETGIIELNTRINFRFDTDEFLRRRTRTDVPGVVITRTNRQMFRNMKGSVTPFYFWETEDAFLENGAGFSVLFNGQLASTAYSAFIHDNLLEIGIETMEAFRGKGFAEQACAALIDYCIENNYEPVWACRLENTGSYKLAQKLGFIPTLKIPYYRFSK